MATYAYTFTSGDTVTPTKLNNARTVSDIVNADIKSDAAIAGTKIAPDFGSQNVATTGTVVAGAGSIISGSSSDAALRITQTGAGNALVIEDSTNPDASPVVFDSTGVQVAGHTSAISAGGGSSPLQLHSSGNIFATQAVATINWGSASAGGGGLITAKARSNGVRETYTTVQSADDLGNWRAFGADGTGFVEAARISVAVDGAPATNDMPGRLVFSTTADGGSSPTERMRITNSGNVGIGTSVPNAAALLDVASTTRGFLPPRMTTAQRDAISNPPAGLVVYNTSTNVLNFYNGSAWGAV